MEANQIIGKYAKKLELPKSMDIYGSNIQLNRDFELNCLVYGLYPEDANDDVDENLGTKVKGKEVAKGSAIGEGTSNRKAPPVNKKKSWSKFLVPVRPMCGGDESGLAAASVGFAEDLATSCLAATTLSGLGLLGAPLIVMFMMEDM